MTRILTFSGWLHAPDVLLPLARAIDSAAAIDTLDYSLYGDYAQLPTQEADITIGWSLGAQIAMRMVADGRLRTKTLVLLAPHVQFVKSADFPFGNKKLQVEAFMQSFALSPKLALPLFEQWLGKKHQPFFEVGPRHKAWLYWGRELTRFSTLTMDFTAFPRCYIFHGREDRVVSYKQSEWLAKRLPQPELVIFDKAGHGVHKDYERDIAQRVQKNNDNTKRTAFAPGF